MVLRLQIALAASLLLAPGRASAQDEPMAADAYDPPAAEGCDANDCCAPRCCGPTYTVWGSVLFMTRTSPRDVPLVIAQNGTFSANEFDFDYEPGFEVGWHAPLDCCNGVTLRYMMFDGLEAEGSFAPLGGFGASGTNPPTPFTGGFDIDLLHTSELKSFEVNLTRDMCGFNFYRGFRYVEIDELFLANGFSAVGAPASATRFNTENRLYGLQIGGDGLLYGNCGPLSLHGFGNAGIYYNDSEANASYSQVIPPAAIAVADADDNVAFVGELGLQARYRVSCNLSVVAGYQLLYAAGVATAPEQLGQINPVAQTFDIDHDDVLYHGFNLGLIGTY